jgi:hypothetical protein
VSSSRCSPLAFLGSTLIVALMIAGCGSDPARSPNADGTAVTPTNTASCHVVSSGPLRLGFRVPPGFSVLETSQEVSSKGIDSGLDAFAPRPGARATGMVNIYIVAETTAPATMLSTATTIDLARYSFTKPSDDPPKPLRVSIAETAGLQVTLSTSIAGRPWGAVYWWIPSGKGGFVVSFKAVVGSSEQRASRDVMTGLQLGGC